MTLRRKFPGLKFGTEAVDRSEINRIFKEAAKVDEIFAEDNHI
ncbi:hypothetical protein TXYLGN1_29880 [Tepidimicrobium xylanilyticum]